MGGVRSTGGCKGRRVADQHFYPNSNEQHPGLPCREVWRSYVLGGQVILFETIEDVFLEARHPPYLDRTERLPILRAVFESVSQVKVTPKRWTVVLDGFNVGGVVIETAELAIDEERLDFRQSIGHTFGAFVTSVTVRGWWGDPLPR